MAAQKFTEAEAHAAIQDLLADGLSRKEIIDVLCDQHDVPLSTAYRWYKDAAPAKAEGQTNLAHEAVAAMRDLLLAAQARQDDEAIERIAEKLAKMTSQLKIAVI